MYEQSIWMKVWKTDILIHCSRYAIGSYPNAQTLQSLPSIIHDPIILISLCWYSHIVYSALAVIQQLLTCTIHGHGRLCPEHTAAQIRKIQAVQSLPSIIHSIQDPCVMLITLISSPKYAQPQRYLHCWGTTPCSCLYKNTVVGKTNM